MYAVELKSDGMIYVPSSIQLGLGIQITLRLLLQQCERL
jgi:hypothetical protein